MREHTYCTPPKYGIIRPEYENNIGWAASNNKFKIKKEKNIALPKLKERGLKDKRSENRRIPGEEERTRRLDEM